MTDIVHAAPDGVFAKTALCGTDAAVAGNLWLTWLPACVTCIVCRATIDTNGESDG